MIGSIWSGTNPFQGYSLTETKKEREQKAADAAASLFDPIQKRKQAEAESTHPEAALGISLENNVKAAIYAGQIAADAEEETTLPVGNASSSSSSKGTAGGEEDDEIEIIYKTTVLPDGSKLLQIITKHPDGSVKTTTTRVPGSKDDESTTKKEKIPVPKNGEGDEENGDGSVGQALMDAVGLE